jgi:hypothetical protein
MTRNASRESAHAPARSADPDRSRRSCARHRRSAAPTTPALLPPSAASPPSTGVAAGTGAPFSTSAMAADAGCSALYPLGLEGNGTGSGRPSRWRLVRLASLEARGSRNPPRPPVIHRGEARRSSSPVRAIFERPGSSAAPSTWRVPDHDVMRAKRRIKDLRGVPTTLSNSSITSSFLAGTRML